MKTFLWLPFSCALLLVISSCSNQNTSTDPLGTGPYDAQGNYHEEWADDPSKWRKPSSRVTTPIEEPPVIAKNDQPPLNANPLGNSSTPKPSITQVNSTPRETTQPIEVASRSKPAVKSTKSTPTAKSTKSTPKRTVAKTKPKPKAKPARYIVKKGDSLSTIANRNGTSVSAIQKANGISGSVIRPGQSLVVPKRR